jgi:hypothetical protein
MGQRNKTRALKQKKFKALGEISCLVHILDEMSKSSKHKPFNDVISVV